MIIRGQSALKAHYDSLEKGDVFIGPLTNAVTKETFLLDLSARGVHCLPSALAQRLSGSKLAQALILNQWMPPLTLAVTRRQELLAALSRFQDAGVAAIISKQDDKHCGHGVRYWDQAETLYNCLAFDKSAYPFVVQPYLTGFDDVRVILAGDYAEAYTRENAFNFRKNLAMGGRSRPYALDDRLSAFCRDIMQRAGFPFAHIDLYIWPQKQIYLGEIALNGGIKGARIDRAKLDDLKTRILDRLAQALST